ncbi:unnamed protein product [Paramecium primaurelia]|uniref:Uncharacterized protein n=1 Tax=Paramecium primaurelia TaxID=5886 RepID=A0A8S1KFX0_PARPR|nr:unnamed protein product [Paramecium primaurelia]
MLLFEYGHLKEKLNISGYFQFENLIRDFIRQQQNKQTILNQCLINKNQDNKIYIVSKIVLTDNYTTLNEQYDELLPKIQQFVDQDKGKELNVVLKSAFDIQSQINKYLEKFQQFNNQDLMTHIQKRFFMKQYLKQQTDQQDKYLGYFKDINEQLKKLKLYQQNQIIDLLIEADAETLEQVYNCIKIEKALQFQFLQEQQNIISDLELNNYFLASLYITDQIISDQNVLEEWLIQENKNQYILEIFNDTLKDLEGYQISFQDNSNQQDKRFIKFKEALLNQLKERFWIFSEEITQFNEDVQLKNEINNLFNRYYKSICLKLQFNNLLEKLIQIILDNDSMEGIVERILELKIQNINKYVLDLVDKYNLVDIDKKLSQLYQKKKHRYLKQLKNRPIFFQQVDIIIDYCNKTSTMIEMENSQALIDFTNSNQQQILEFHLMQTLYNYDNLYSDEQFLPELFKQTNKFCPDLSILKSTQYVIFQQKIQFMRLKQEKRIGKQQQKQKNKLQYLDYEKLDIKKVIQQHQNSEQSPAVIYENRIWNQFHNQIISECNIILDQEIKKKRNKAFDEQKKKYQSNYEQYSLIPFDWIETIFSKSYEEMKEEETMKNIDDIFKNCEKEEENYFKELQEYVEFENDIIKNRNKQIKEYFNSLGKKNYETIKELEEDLKNLIKLNREQLFKQQYLIKNSIQEINQEYIKQCQEILKYPPTHLQQYKVDKQTQLNDLRDINNQILSFYGEQLINHLKQQKES